MNTDSWSEHTRNLVRSAALDPSYVASTLVPGWIATLAKLGLEMFPSAKSALLEFGGIRVVQHGRGQTCAKSSFVIDPTEVDYDRISDFAAFLRVPLFPLGTCGGSGMLWIDQNGRVCMTTDSLPMGHEDTIYQAIESLSVGLLFSGTRGIQV